MIEVKHDHKLSFPTITVPISAEDPEDNTSRIKQTNVEGILVPLLRYNDTTINFHDIRYMELTCNPVPKIRVEIHDTTNSIKDMDKPGMDNNLYLQILPPFDDAYRKIQLRFYITYSSIDGPNITFEGVYYVPGIMDTRMKAYGLTTTYEMMDSLANELSLGFCSNVSGSDDKRWIYNPNKPMTEFINREIRFAGKEKHVYDWWIDFWNNLTLVDLYEEYNTMVDEKDMMIWECTSLTIVDDSSEMEEPRKVAAAFSNLPAFQSSPMYIDNYIPVTKSSGVTDRNFETYSFENMELTSALIQDGDVKNKVLLRYEYGGELYGEFDYLLQRASREAFLDKIYSECIEVSVCMPAFGLIKGGKVNLWWYDIDSYVTQARDQSDLESNVTIPAEPESDGNDVDSYRLNRTISGQYYIMDIKIEYDGGWTCTYTLSRSAEKIQKLNPPTNENDE